MVLDPTLFYTAITVYVNDQRAGALIYNPGTIDITDYLVEGENTLRIETTPLENNRRTGFAQAYEDTGEMQYFYCYLIEANPLPLNTVDTLLDGGIEGPVVLKVFES